MSQTPASFPIHGNAAAEHWAKEARKWSDHTHVALMVSALTMFVFSLCMGMALDRAADAAIQAAESAKEAHRIAHQHWWAKPGAVTTPLPPTVVYDHVGMLQCDANKCEVR